MTARVFADTNVAIYAEGSDVGKAQRATAILESSPVISSQVVTETISTLTRKYGFNDPQAVAEMTPAQVDAVKAVIADIDKNHPELKRDPFVLGTIAGDGALIALYNAVFRAASGDAAHISLDALNRHIRADTDANIQGLRFGPEVSDLPDTLSIAISAFGLAVFTAIELFELQSFNDELAQCMDEWKGLGIPSEFKAA